MSKDRTFYTTISYGSSNIQVNKIFRGYKAFKHTKILNFGKIYINIYFYEHFKKSHDNSPKFSTGTIKNITECMCRQHIKRNSF